ncbi:protein of unknown function [Nitrospira japonica]|uniref:Uncharacterized protein n=1 Tax=Nitrospira japonica TaxID=1325564 RepID=A0A1W1I2M0_9BACT|nr:protein of unknown function [Nitrospira japonica]
MLTRRWASARTCSFISSALPILPPGWTYRLPQPKEHGNEHILERPSRDALPLVVQHGGSCPHRYGRRIRGTGLCGDLAYAVLLELV